MWVGLLYLTFRSKTDKGVEKDKFMAEMSMGPGTLRAQYAIY